MAIMNGRLLHPLIEKKCVDGAFGVETYGDVYYMLLTVCLHERPT